MAVRKKSLLLQACRMIVRSKLPAACRPEMSSCWQMKLLHLLLGKLNKEHRGRYANQPTQRLISRYSVNAQQLADPGRRAAAVVEPDLGPAPASFRQSTRKSAECATDDGSLRTSHRRDSAVCFQWQYQFYPDQHNL